MRPWMIAAVAAAVALPGAACAQVGSGTPEPAKLILTAEGQVSAAPDMARVTAGVVAQADTASAAMDDQRTRMNEVMTALDEAGIPESDIQTTSIELYPIYAPYDEQQREQRITGYQAANRVTVTARDLTLVGPTLDALVKAGANDISNITFDIAESDSLLDEARRDAVSKLRERADLYADAAGIRVGRILELSESGGFQPYPVLQMARAVADGSTPVSGGELTLSISVTATFEIEN